MASSCSSSTPCPLAPQKLPLSLSPFLLLLLLLLLLVPPSTTEAKNNNSNSSSSSTLQPNEELLNYNYRRVRAHLRRLSKPSVKTIKSPDGDVIDCVPSHLQPAFDHPMLKGQKPLDPPERPKGHNYNYTSMITEEEEELLLLQTWRTSGESCPQGTVPVRRIKEEDILRANSIGRFGRKPVAAARRVRRDSTSGGHEASLNVWSPRVATESEFSLSQIWVISGSFGNDLNTIEAGWQVSPQLYGDDCPRVLQSLLRRLVQTNNKIAIGAAISPTSIYNGRQFDISLLVWKDPKHGHWWLEFGSGLLVGYWPSFLFSHLAQHANMVQFGGEIVNSGTAGSHTSTEMGSGHFAHDGFNRAAYFRNLQIVDWDNSLIPISNLRLLADHPNCYDIQGGSNGAWGNYFYYGGPGRNVRCP
uniref:Neprosin PEP catalytic domain-containing protein n=1 Tax=Ananas comosus var. bracteatus TaxID=296719 RepID=A0A6V7QIQ0_ANACO|nr:unnamed protein product [Ananas comosus var. bracteatus]